MRLSVIVFAAAAVLSAGCAYTPEYYDNSAQVDANPLCATRPNRPNQPLQAGDPPIPAECVRDSGVRYERKGQPVDFRRKTEEDGS